MALKKTNQALLQKVFEQTEKVYAKQTALETLEGKVTALEGVGAQANVIETVKVNGTALEVENKAVDVTVPTVVSELTNDSNYQTGTEVSEAIATAIAATGHAAYTIVETVPDAADAEENVLYLVMNSETGYYDIYALITGSVVRIDDTSIDLTQYSTTEEMNEAISTAIDGIDLSAYLTENDFEEFTDEEVAAAYAAAAVAVAEA